MGEIVLALVELVIRFRDFFVFWTVLDEYERGVVLRLGRFQEDRGDGGIVGPGIIWHRPFGIDVVLQTNVVYEVGDAELQMVTTDGVTVNIEVVAGYSISNVRKFLLEVEEAGDAVLDAIGGAVFEFGRTRSWNELNDPAFVTELQKGIARRGVRFGVRIETVYIHSLTRLGLRHGVIKTVNTAN